MPRRIARLFFRAAGWLLTPLVLATAAAIGATIGLVAAPALSPNVALGLTVVFALAAAIIGLIFWLRLLRTHPELRHTLEMTVQGVPESVLVDHIMHPEHAEQDAKQ